MKRNIVLSALVAGAALSAGTLGAQSSSTSGFMLNAHLSGTGISGTVDASELQSGGGIGLAVGYGFNERVTLFLNVDGAVLEYVEGDQADGDDGKYNVSTADLGLRINFGSESRKLRPYLNTGFTGVVQSDEADGFESSVSGGGLLLGAGLQYFFTPSLAFDGALNLTTGSFTTFEINDEEADLDEGVGFNHSRLQLGVTWHP